MKSLENWPRITQIGCIKVWTWTCSSCLWKSCIALAFRQPPGFCPYATWPLRILSTNGWWNMKIEMLLMSAKRRTKPLELDLGSLNYWNWDHLVWWRGELGASLSHERQWPWTLKHWGLPLSPHKGLRTEMKSFLGMYLPGPSPFCSNPSLWHRFYKRERIYSQGCQVRRWENNSHVRLSKDKSYRYLWVREVEWSKVWGKVICSEEQWSNRSFMCRHNQGSWHFHKLYVQKMTALAWSESAVFGSLMSKAHFLGTCSGPFDESVVSTGLNWTGVGSSSWKATEMTITMMTHECYL